jgi:hypothetical protein
MGRQTNFRTATNVTQCWDNKTIYLAIWQVIICALSATILRSEYVMYEGFQLPLFCPRLVPNGWGPAGIASGGSTIKQIIYSVEAMDVRSISTATERWSRSTDTTMRSAPSSARTMNPFTPAKGPRSISIRWPAGR